MRELAIVLMMWISAQTGYQVNVQPPAIVFMTPNQVSDTCIDEGTLIPYVAESCYKLHKHSIYIRSNFDIRDPNKVGVLVHELTHVLQLSNGKKYNLQTMNMLEAEAEKIEKIYEMNRTLQAQVLQRFGPRTMTAARSGPTPLTIHPQGPQVFTPPRGPLQPPSPSSHQVARGPEPALSLGPPAATPHGDPIPTKPIIDLFPDDEDIANRCGVSEKRYQDLASEKDSMQSDLDQAKTELETLQKELLALREEKKKLEEYVTSLREEVGPEKVEAAAAKPEPKKEDAKPAQEPKETPKKSKADKTPLVPNKYTVKSGDSLWSIAHQYQITVKSIRELNELAENKIKPGQELKLPPR